MSFPSESVTSGKDKCAICICTIQHLAVLDACRHSFCYDCIKKWSESALRCPLCVVEFTSLSHKPEQSQTFVSEILQKPTKKVDETQPNLDGLTDSYFLSEIDRLRKNGEKANKELFGGKSLKRHDNYGHGRLQEVLKRLKGLEDVMRSDRVFNPNEAMAELYQIDHILQILWTGRSEDLVSVPSASVSPQPPSRYGADDALLFEEEDDYQEDYEDDYEY